MRKSFNYSFVVLRAEFDVFVFFALFLEELDVFDVVLLLDVVLLDVVFLLVVFFSELDE